MATDLPLACSLSTAEMPKRLAEMAAIGRSSLLDAQTEDRTALLRFRDDPGTRRRVAEIVAAESECCAFLTMRLRDEPGAIALSIKAPAGAEPVLAGLLEAFGGPAG